MQETGVCEGKEQNKYTDMTNNKRNKVTKIIEHEEMVSYYEDYKLEPLARRI